MQDLIEIVEDLEMIETVGVDSPGFEHIVNKWVTRKADAEAEMERQFEMEFQVSQLSWIRASAF